MAIRRDKSVSSKVTAEEYEACKKAAGARSVSEWNRAVLLHELEQQQSRSIERRLMEELWALRYIVINLLATMGGEAVSATIDGLLKTADEHKAEEAAAMLRVKA